MPRFLNNFRDKQPTPRSPQSGKGKFLMLCAVMSAIYLIFSFAFHAYADPPGSPYTPGETLNPTCSPTSTNCTVLPPLFSTTTLPMGGVLYMSDTSGTVSANTSTLYWNSQTNTFLVGATPQQASTSALLYLGPNGLIAGNTSGTYIGVNQETTSTGANFINFEDTSSTVFNVGPAGDLEVGTGTQAAANALFTVGSSSDVFYVLSNGQILSAGNFNASGTITQSGIAVLTTSSINIGGTQSSTFNLGFDLTMSSTGTISCPNCGSVTTSTNGTLNAIPLWTSASALGNSIITQNTSSIQIFQIPQVSTSVPLLSLGAQFQDGNVSGTLLGGNVSSTYNGDLIDFKANSSTQFEVGSSGAFLFMGNGLIGGKLNVTGTITTGNLSSTNITFTNATGSGNFQVGTGIFTTLASSTGITFTNATGSGNFFATNISSTGLLFTNATGSNNFQVKTGIFTSLASSTGITFTNATGSNELTLTASGTTAFVLSGMPARSSSTSLIQLGPFALSTTTASVTGTFIGANPLSSSSFGDFINFQVNSGTVFRVGSAGQVLIGPATGTLGFYSSSTALTVCSRYLGGTCGLPTTLGSGTVAVFGSAQGGNTSTSILARGVISGGMNDIGEYAPVLGGDGEYSAGDVLSVSDAASGTFQKSSVAYDPQIAGVVTVTAGFVAGGGIDGHGSTVIALAGRVPVTATTENGPIHIGDLLTSSNMPGVAMLATQPGRVIGLALQDDLGDPSAPDATSQVLMFVNPGWSLGNLTSTAEIASSSWALMGVSSSSSAIDQFTAYVQAALAKLGVMISNGVATLQGVVANTVNTNELCVQGVCVNGSQFSAMMNKNGGGPSNQNNPPPTDTNVNTPDQTSAPNPVDSNASSADTSGNEQSSSGTISASPDSGSSDPASSGAPSDGGASSDPSDPSGSPAGSSTPGGP